ncbi:MAG TPA: c-type cytochrome [Sphingomicrobium sp.]|nr:c-type cytochrome [Sphingomicrobium sp.]
MSSRFRASLVLVGALGLLLAACDREERHSRAKPFGETVPGGVAPGALHAGNPPAVPPRSGGDGGIAARAAAYEGNAYAIAHGMQLYSWMNCVGCHSHGGGGMGPALMDAQWRYGGRIDEIASSIAEGRPNGMPSWRSKLTEDQIWQLAAYVRSLSGQVRKDAVGARADTVSNTPPQTTKIREKIVRGQ